MNYLLDTTLDYLPKYDESTNFYINCCGESGNRLLYDMTIDVDGCVVGNISFSNKNDVVFIRESTIVEKFEYLIEEAIEHIKDAYDTELIIEIKRSRSNPIELRML